jgi:hypothetical protein
MNVQAVLLPLFTGVVLNSSTPPWRGREGLIGMVL